MKLADLVQRLPKRLSGDPNRDLSNLIGSLADIFRRTTTLLQSSGEWTPTDASGAGLTLTITSATFVKTGRSVFLHADVSYPVTASGSIAKIGMPYVPTAVYTGSVATTGAGNPVACQADSTGINFVSSAGVAATNANFSGAIVRLGVTFYV